MKKKQKKAFNKLFILIILIIGIIGLYKLGNIDIKVYAEATNNTVNEKINMEENIILVNKDNPLPDDYKVELEEYDEMLDYDKQCLKIMYLCSYF